MYDYTARNSFSAELPVSEQQLTAWEATGHEMMADSCDCIRIPGDFGVSLREFNSLAMKIQEEGITKKGLRILSETYLYQEIADMVEAGEMPQIIDFQEETSSWSSSDFYDERDKGLLLYSLGLLSFPAPVPEALKEYMDYAALYRDESINSGFREVSGRYIIL